jgi:hypothetical protein
MSCLYPSLGPDDLPASPLNTSRRINRFCRIAEKRIQSLCFDG